LVFLLIVKDKKHKDRNIVGIWTICNFFCFIQHDQYA